MSIKKANAFDAIKKLLMGTDPDAPSNAKTMDGQILQWTGELAEGTPITIVDETGNQTPAPDNDYEIEDGTIISTVGGLVTKIVPKAQDEPDADSDEMKKKKADEELAAKTEKDSGDIDEIKKKMASQSETLAKVSEALKQCLEEMGKSQSGMEEMKSDVETKFSSIVKLFEEIANEPAVAPIQKPASFLKKTKKADSENEKISAILKWKKDLKK